MQSFPELNKQTTVNNQLKNCSITDGSVVPWHQFYLVKSNLKAPNLTLKSCFMETADYLTLPSNLFFLCNNWVANKNMNVSYFLDFHCIVNRVLYNFILISIHTLTSIFLLAVLPSCALFPDSPGILQFEVCPLSDSCFSVSFQHPVNDSLVCGELQEWGGLGQDICINCLA